MTSTQIPQVRRHALEVALGEFALRVLADPDKPAIVDGGRTVTFGELDRWSSSLAHGLRRAPATAQPVVSIVSWLGADAIALLLATSKAGLVPAPLDPREPDDVLLATAERLGSRLVLVDPGRAAALGSGGSRSGVSSLASLESGEITWPELAVDPGRPIFLAATSGSTGASRTVVVPPSIADVMDDMRLVDSSAASVGVLLPPMFIAAFAPITSAWRAGATAHCFDLSRVPASEMPGWMERAELTAFALTPSLVRSVFEPLVGSGRALAAVERVTLSGETLTGADVNVLRRIFPGATFVNVYGSADAALVSRFEIPPGHDVPDGPVPVGVPLRPVEIIDDRGDPVAPGEVGIITAVGSWLPMALELDGPLDLERLDLDAVRSVPTGDLGRLLPDGSLELLGRADHRVKVRGQMADPGRIEAALVGLADVSDAVVTPIADGHATVLVGHVVPRAGTTPRTSDLRRALGAVVPSFMIPDRFVLVSELPRLATGKPDRLTLTERARATTSDRPEAVEPRTGTERTVAQLFGEVLAVATVGRDDDFFDLGGDSLAAVELATAVEETFGVVMGAADLLDQPSVAGLAAWIDDRRRSRPRAVRGRTRRFPLVPVRDGGRRLVTLRADGSRPPIYAVPGAGGSMFQLLPLAEALEDRPFHQFVPKGMDARTWPNYTIESMARRYLESVADVEGPYVLAGNSAGGLVVWEMARQLAACGRAPACLLLLDPSGFESRLGGLRARVARAVGSTGPLRGESSSATALTRLSDDQLRADRALIAAAVRHALAKGPGPLARSVRTRCHQVYRFLVPPLTVGLVRRGAQTEQDLFYSVGAVAARRYAPRRYGGSVMLVLSRRREAWTQKDRGAVARLCDQHVETIFAEGSHSRYLRHPHLPELALALNRALPR